MSQMLLKLGNAEAVVQAQETQVFKLRLRCPNWTPPTLGGVYTPHTNVAAQQEAPTTESAIKRMKAKAIRCPSCRALLNVTPNIERARLSK